MNLNQLRKQIDEIDLKLLSLLNRRAALAVKIGQIKRRRGLPVFDSRREEAVLRRISRIHRGPLTALSIRRIFRGIFSHSRKLQSS